MEAGTAEARSSRCCVLSDIRMPGMDGKGWLWSHFACKVMCIALAAPLVLSSCSRTVSSSDATAPASSTAQEQVSPAESDESAESAASSDESWKTDFEKSLWENYNVTPEYYEDLGDGVYQVYVKIDGKTVPYVCVDSATGDYHG